MSRPQIDFANIEEAELQLKALVASAWGRADRWKALRDSLDPEQLELLYAVMKDKEVTEWAVGALAVLKPLRRERAALRDREQHTAKVLAAADPDILRRLRMDLHNTKQQLASKSAQLKDAKAQLAQLRAAQGRPGPAAPQPTPEAPKPWDYAPVKRYVPGPGEVITDDPFGVAVVADQIEKFVKHRGRCAKSDVSAAFPQLRPHLTTAYRHLHASRRVRVQGRTLEPWPEQEKK